MSNRYVEMLEKSQNWSPEARKQLSSGISKVQQVTGAR